MRVTALRLAAILLCTVGVAAQSDPISGDWGVDGRHLLTLQFDGKQTVTGTVFVYSDGIQRASAAIQTGSFDPRSRTLKLAGQITPPDGNAIAYLIEGTLENDLLSVTYRFGSNEGRETLRRL